MGKRNQSESQKIIEKKKEQSKRVENFLKELNIKIAEVPKDLSTINEDISILIKDTSIKKKK